jgi:precorrin-2 dehydrogenase/sirohydrochlorin ferrochelatase
MEYYPIFVRVAGRRCLVVGGGELAAQKTRGLLDAGAGVTVISPNLNDELRALVDQSRIEHRARPYQGGDIDGFFLAFAATGSDAIDQQIRNEAEAAGVMLNVVDRTHLCDFIAPAIVSRGDLTVAISTSGTSPAMAKRIRQKLEDDLGTEYALALQLLGRLRKRLQGSATTAAERSRIFDALADSPLLDLLRQRRFDEVDALLAAAVGGEISLSTLEIDWGEPR